MIRRFARPYAAALLKTARGLEAQERAREELGAFVEALAAVPALGDMARNPAIPMEVKERVLAEIGESLDIGLTVASFLRQLLHNNRLQSAPAVLEAVDAVLERRLGKVTAQVKSAAPLDEEERGQLGSTLGRLFDQEVDLEVTLAPELLGGFVAQVGSRRYDASLRGQLDRLRGALAQAAETGGGA